MKAKRDLERTYPKAQFVAKLRRFADAVETGEAFTIQIAGERVRVPGRARFSIEHEREGGEEEIEFQMRWKSDPEPAKKAERPRKAAKATRTTRATKARKPAKATKARKPARRSRG